MTGDDRTAGGSTESEDGSGVATGAPSGDVAGALASERRRAVLRHLQTTDGEASLVELGSAVFATERSVDASPACRRRVELSLHHVHLPKLEDAGVLDYDRSEKTARLRAGVGPLLESLPIEWDR